MERALARLTLVVSNGIKVGGLFVALKAISHPPPDSIELALSAFMMSGAQVSEKAVLRMISGFLGREEAKKPDHKELEK